MIASCQVVSAASFMALGDLLDPATPSGVSALSDDGRVAAGSVVIGPTGNFFRNQAVFWDTATGGATAAPFDPAEDDLFFVPTALSEDGSVLVGGTTDQPDSPIDDTSEAAIVTPAGGLELLGQLPGGVASAARDVNASGDVVVGTSGNREEILVAFRWTREGGMQSLGVLEGEPGPFARSGATAVSRDGSVVVGGASSLTSNGTSAFRWTEASGMVALGSLLGNVSGSFATDVSADGSVVVGHSASERSGGAAEAMRWDEVTGMQGLGFLHPEDYDSQATLVSDDGKVIFGRSDQLFVPSRSFVWRENMGMRDFTAVLEEDYALGNAMAGWSQLAPADISSDGLTIVGNGTNPDGRRQAWVVVLDRPIGVPEPSAPLLGLASLVWAAGRRRQ